MSAYIQSFVDWCDFQTPRRSYSDPVAMLEYAVLDHPDTPVYVHQVLIQEFITEPIITGPSEPWMDEEGTYDEDNHSYGCST